jgi:ubiquinone/menaquinone biosynthesis C-methylase UbiE
MEPSSSFNSTALALFVTTATVTTLSQKVSLSSIVGGIYDKLCVHMTETWYRNVLCRQDNNSVILDCGIGTSGESIHLIFETYHKYYTNKTIAMTIRIFYASTHFFISKTTWIAALIRCKDIIMEKNLKIIGVDYNELYVNAAKDNIRKAKLEDYVQVYCASIYDIDQIREYMKDEKLQTVYFSGSFSLLPDPSSALLAVSHLLRDNGKIYITQTYQRKAPPLIAQIKPLIKYVTTIDFGKLIRVQDVEEIFEKTRDVLEVEVHEVIGKDSIDNMFQAAYISILKLKH